MEGEGDLDVMNPMGIDRKWDRVEDLVRYRAEREDMRVGIYGTHSLRYLDKRGVLGTHLPSAIGINPAASEMGNFQLVSYESFNV